MLGVALIASACGQTGPRVSEQEARELARSFAIALLESPNREAALRAARPLAEPVVLEDVEFWWRTPSDDTVSAAEDRFRVVSGPRAGCSPSLTEPFTVWKDDPCYRFRIVGRPAPDPTNEGAATIGFGTLAVWIRPRGSPPTVGQFLFSGGFRVCGLAVNCSSAERMLLRRGREWREWP